MGAVEEKWEKWAKWGVLAVLCLAAVVGILNRDRLPVYIDYLRDPLPEVTMRYAQLSGQMDEAAVHKHFQGIALNCRTHPGGPAGTDRFCHSGLSKADGEAALTLVAFFSKGRLTSVVVHVPWWVHGRSLDRLVAQYGKAERAGVVSLIGGPVMRWNLPNGTLEHNRDRSLNPLEWSAIFWSAGQDQKK
ncbi:hypothetical protein [Polaromonas aquatica]|uniref:hypothetical protein n=1 Tax=Polaromonas aquatica TaxID=332657 RepID=UPI003D64A425